ncbi:MAG: GGDEF domain-containing protein [Planctomycetes bacterium]|nr:GGDEF domain-containing protein [Planctomycetota bacterium]
MNEPHHNPFSQRRFAAVLAVLIAVMACETAFGGGDLFEMAYVPILLFWAWRLPCPSAITAAVAVSLIGPAIAAVTDSQSVLSTPILANALRRCFVLSVIAVLASRLRTSRLHAFALARRDALTGMPNRLQFVERVEAEANRCRRSGKPFSLAYLDCDDFKTLNDTCGHAAGDRFLRVVSETLTRSLRNYDLAARLGGDEFALLISETDAKTAGEVVRRVQGTLVQQLQSHGWNASFSVGLTTFVDSDCPAEEMIATADAAMYQAKRDGAGGIVACTITGKPSSVPQPAP